MRVNVHYSLLVGLLLSILPISTIYAQESNVLTGCVLDSKGEPLIGASVIVNGSSSGVITDADGNFTITASKDNVLTVSYVGFQTRELNLARRRKTGPMRITLMEDVQTLSEVVVTAMGIKAVRQALFPSTSAG